MHSFLKRTNLSASEFAHYAWVLDQLSVEEVRRILTFAHQMEIQFEDKVSDEASERLAVMVKSEIAQKFAEIDEILTDLEIDVQELLQRAPYDELLTQFDKIFYKAVAEILSRRV